MCVSVCVCVSVCMCCRGIEKCFCIMISSSFRQRAWSATEIKELALGRFLKYILTDAQNGIGNYYPLVSNAALSQQSFLKILLEKSDNLI